MATIALDAMGSDLGPDATVGGAAEVSRRPQGPDILLVGDEGELRARLERLPHDSSRVRIVPAAEVVGMHDDAREALDARPQASMTVAAELVRDGEADALVSAGNTGAVTLACARAFGRLPGIERCALGAVYPTELRHGETQDPFSLILDAGLTLKVTAEDLVGFAIMGSAYAARISRNPRPRVALLSNGTEPHKGIEAVVEAHRRLAELDSLEFIGNIEGLDIPRGTADVVVTGGFSGNIVLKMLEGVAGTMQRLGRYAFKQSWRNKLALALLAPAIRTLRNATDWEQYGGAPILGFDRLCIKAHGRSSAKAVGNALRVAHKATRTEIIAAIREGLGATR